MYPVRFFIPRILRSSRLLLLARPFMVMPLLLWQIPYGIGAAAAGAVAFFAVLLLGRYPAGLWHFMENYFRAQCQLSAYLFLLNDRYPPFIGRENNRHPVRVRVDFPPRLDRLQVLFRCILLIPQCVPGVFFTMLACAVLFLTFWVVLFTGHIPEAFWRVLERYVVWSSRVQAYSMFLVDEYPPFHGRQSMSASADARNGI